MISIALAKSGLTLSQIGLYETLLFIGTALTFFWIAGLLNGMLPIYPKLSNQEKGIFLFNSFLLFVGLSITVFGILWIGAPYLVPWLTDFQTLPYYHLLCWYLLINLPTYLVEYIYLLKKKPFKILWFGIFSFGGQFLVVALPLFLGYSLAESFQGLIILAGLKFIWLLTALHPNIKIQFQPKILYPYLQLAIPIVLYTLVGGMMEFIDLTLVSKYLGEEELAIYRNGARELPLSLALLGAVYTALIPIVADNMETGLKEIKQRTSRLMPLLFLLSAGLMFVAPIIFPIVWNEDFAESAWIFNIYLLLITSRILLPQTILLGLGKAKIILWISIIEISINLALSLLFIQFWGLKGIALATVIAFLLEKVMTIAYNYFKLNISPTQYIDWKRFGFYNLILMLSFWISWTIF